jgi:5-methylcytosine-specific restriction endonuclease McrA
MKHHGPCLILNADYAPLATINWQRAYCLYYQQSTNIEILNFYKNDYIIGPNNITYKLPAVIRIKKYLKLYMKEVKFSRKNLFLRDNFTCQYCNMQYEFNKLTYDHVIPKSIWNKKHGPPTCWTNITTACLSCNKKKGNKTPEQANMNLNKKPSVPSKTQKYLPMSHTLRTIEEDIPIEWQLYLAEYYA